MQKLIQKIKKIPKTYFTISDIKKITDLSDESLRVSISRLIKNKELVKIRKGIYVLDDASVQYENMAVNIYKPSYISFEWALGYYGILSQQAVNLTLATTKRSRIIELHNSTFIYHHLQDKLYWGYIIENDFLIAEPEKAFLDLAYLSLNGYAKLDVEEMNTEILDMKKLKRYAKKFNDKRLDVKLKDSGMVF